eukprot:g24147.t1
MDRFPPPPAPSRRCPGGPCVAPRAFEAMEHQALPTLQEVASTLQKLGVEHERQLSELRRQDGKARAEETPAPASPSVVQQADGAPIAPEGCPEDLPLEAPAPDSSLRPGGHITLTTTWASKQYRAPGLSAEGGDVVKLPNLRDDAKKAANHQPGDSNFKLHPFFNEKQRAGLRREENVKMEHVTNLAMAGLSMRDKEEAEKSQSEFGTSSKMSRMFDAQEPAQKPRWWVSMPGNRRNVVWDVVGAIFVLYDCFMIPLRVFDPPVTPMVVTTEWLGLLYWTVNIPVTLTLGYVVDGQAIMDPYRIFIHYLKTWFVVDATVLPFDWTFAIMDLDPWIEKGGRTSQSDHPWDGSM